MATQGRPAEGEDLKRGSGYFANNKRRMNCLELREAGWVMGSGTVESGVKQFKERFAGPGMHMEPAGPRKAHSSAGRDHEPTLRSRVGICLRLASKLKCTLVPVSH